MSLPTKHFYEFGAYRLDARDHLLLCDGEVVPLPPKTFDLLLALVESSGRVLSKEELMKQVWPDTFVEEGNLSHHVFSLRKALGEDNNGRAFIETIPRRGYRFLAEVSTIEEEGSDLVLAELTRTHLVVEEEMETDQKGSALEGAQANRAQASSKGETRRWLGGNHNLAAWVLAVVVIATAIAAYRWMTSNDRAGSAGLGVRSIAVLPFRPLVADSRDETLELGMADTLINRLSVLREVTVRPVSAVRRYSDLQQDATTAGKELNVESVLEGNIQKAGDRVRVTLRLVKVADGALLWADKFDEKFTDIFSVQDAIAEKVAGALVQLNGQQRRDLAKHHTENAQAYLFYTQGRYFWNKRSEEGFKKGIDFFSQAIEADPAYALAYSGLADCYALLANSSALAPGDGFRKAKAAAIKALQIDDSLAEAHTSLAFVLHYDSDLAAAETEFKRAIELNPNYATAHQWYADYLDAAGRAREALQEIQLALQNDPLSLVINAELADYFQSVGQTDKAMEQIQKALEMDPNFIRTHQVLGSVYLQNRMFDQAIAEFQRARQLDGNPRTLRTLGHAYAIAGKRAEATKIISELKALSTTRYVPPIYIAALYADLGEEALAFYWIDKAYEERQSIGVVRADEDFRRLRSDSRFAERLRRFDRQ
ncbi:MAG TPA: winged helix-turn-helix domain-containing protein [Blastocatellia bacterium]|nr:winged helix-turn-helix domain-containing protein [Blastocatellia bacterium]